MIETKLLTLYSTPVFTSIKIGKEKLAMETELSDLLQEERWLQRRIDKLRNSLENLNLSPELYFKIKSIL